jgi:hypothetical protein
MALPAWSAPKTLILGKYLKYMNSIMKTVLLTALILSAATGCSQAADAPPHPLAAAGAYVVSAQINGVDQTRAVVDRQRDLELYILRILDGAKVPVLSPKHHDDLADSAVASLTFGEHTWDINVPGFLPSKGYELGLRIVEAARLVRDKDILVPVVVYHDANFGLSPPASLDQNLGEYRARLLQKFLRVHQGTRNDAQLRSGKNAAELTNQALTEAMKQPFRSLHGIHSAVICVLVEDTLPANNRLRATVLENLAEQLRGAGVKVSIARPGAAISVPGILARNDAYVEMTIEGFAIRSGGENAGGIISHVGLDVWQQVSPVNHPDRLLPAVTYSDERVGHAMQKTVEPQSRAAADLVADLKSHILP